MLRLLISIKLKGIFEGMSATTSKKKKKGGAGTVASYIVLFAVLFIVVAGLFGTIFYQVAGAFAASGLGWFYFALMGIFIFLLCFVGSVFLTQTQLFESKDNELLLSMPIKPSTILASRIISLLLLNYVYELIIAVPAAVVYAVKGHFTAGSAAVFVVAVVLLPLLAVAVSSVFGWIIAAISSRMKRKRLVGMTLSLVLFAAYMYICVQWQIYVQKLIENGEAIAAAIERSLPPFYHMGVAINDANILSLVIFAAWTIIPFAIVYLLVSKSFIKIATAKRGGVRIEYKEKEMKVSGVKKALLINEIRRFTGSTMYMFNAGIGLGLMPIIAIYMAVKSGEFGLLLSRFDPDHIISAGIGCLIILFMASLTVISSPTISLEAKTMWIIKTLPIKTKDVLVSKALLHIVLSIPFIVISGAIMAVFYEMNPVGIALMILVPCAYVVFTGIAGVLINLRFPKFNWVNETAAVKQGLAPSLAILVSMVAIIIPVFIYFFVIKDTSIAMEVYMGIVLVVFAVLSLIAYRLLVTKGVKRFEMLQGA